MGRMAKRNRRKNRIVLQVIVCFFPGQMIKMYLVVVVVSSAYGAVRRRVYFLFSWLPLICREKLSMSADGQLFLESNSAGR